MILSDQNRQTLLVDLHRIIEEQAQHTITKIFDHPQEDRSIYPPDISLADSEKDALAQLPNNQDLRSALKKVFEDHTATVLFRFFSIIDRTSVPDPNSGSWTPVALVDLPEGYDQQLAYLHDHFFETYWNWKEIFETPKHNIEH